MGCCLSIDFEILKNFELLSKLRVLQLFHSFFVLLFFPLLFPDGCKIGFIIVEVLTCLVESDGFAEFPVLLFIVAGLHLCGVGQREQQLRVERLQAIQDGLFVGLGVS
jgi:hypothetical protein